MSKVSKIKVSLTNGNIIEKPLVTCFKGTNGNYLVLDNETNGSMGLPIICISKFLGDKLEKIYDQAEWTSVKENLKAIIAGNNLPYLNVPEQITAPDDFYTQLTLPVASFDLLKNVYHPIEVASGNSLGTINPQPMPAQPSPAPVQPSPMPETQGPVMNMGSTQVLGQSPISFGEPVGQPLNQPNGNLGYQAPAMEPMGISSMMNNNIPVGEPSNQTPTFEQPPVFGPAPVMEPTPIAPTPVQPSPMPEIETPVFNNPIPQPTAPVAPVPGPSSTKLTPEEIKEIKDTFMKSCENMFDALLKKFEK